MNKPIWKPSPERKENSLLMDFSNFINFQPKSFEDLWKWTVENPKKFWSKFWDCLSNQR